MKKSKLFRKILNFTGVSGLAGLGFVACGPGAADLSIMPVGQSTYQGSVANNKVDVLWVIDNSGSMYTKQEKLGAGFSSFVQVFTNKNFDFRIAVTTSDTRATPAGQAGEFQSLPYPYQHPTDGTRSNPVNYVGANGPSVKIITNSTTNLADHFISNVRVGDTGDANAKILDAITLALDSNALAGVNTGFLRADAHLAVIMVSDADDGDSNFGLGSTASITNVQNTLQTLKPDRFDVITRKYKKNFTVSAVVVNNPADTNCVVPFEEGVEFKQLSTATNGSIANICDNNFATGLNQISQRIAEAITEIPLAQAPDTSTIKIYFNSALVPQDATNGWTYESSGNKVVFHGNYIPEDNTSISINYTPRDIIR
jgi:hypothetical protein